ncbi:MAG: alkaline phosphatase D family protein [Caulobacterales bacterium]
MDRRAVVGGLCALGALAPNASAAPDWDGYPRVMQGPMLGANATGLIRIWVRVSGPFETQIEFASAANPSQTQRSAVISARREQDFIVVHTLEGLAPGTEFIYRVLVAGAPDPDTTRQPPFRARTALASPSAFRVGFGSCARRQRHPVQPIWDALNQAEPDLFFWLGDNIYGDSLERSILLEEYLRQRDVPNCRRFMAGRPQLAIWDDHDFGLNDSDRRNPIRNDALSVFKQVWANPNYGLPNTPGVFFAHSYGGVDFFFLDNRFHRDPADAPDTAAKTTLGAKQLDWLKTALLASRAPFKLILCGQPWNDGKKPGSESWSSYTVERADLFAFIARERIGGVVLVSGDTHIGEVNSLPHARYGAGYDLFEFVSSPLAQDCATSYLNYRPIERIRQVYAGGSNAGLIDFDMTGADPTLTFNLLDTQGASVWAPLVLKASDLQPGRSIWRDKMDAASLARWRRVEAGGAYYGPG